METIAKIRRMYYIESKGFKTIARQLNLSKNTVKKIIRNDITRQEYNRKFQPFSKLGIYLDKLKEKLEYDRQEPVRRRRTSKKLYDELKEDGYKGSYEAVNNFVKSWKLNRQELKTSTYVPLQFSAGEAFQFDWSEEEVEIQGELTRIKIAHIRLCYSRFFLLVAYPNEQLEMVMDAHDKAFEFFGGSCHQGTYDNMKTAVKKVFIGKNRIFNEKFKEMTSHHLFKPVACTPAAGWEKGQVENQVSTARRNFFTPLRRIESLSELNQQLKTECVTWAKKTKHPELKEQTVWDIYLSEKPSLLQYKGAFQGYKLISTSVSTTSMVKFDGNAYSVDCHYTKKAVEIRAYPEKIMVYYHSELIGEHKRSFSRHKKIYNPWHYVPILERKPGALRHGAPFKDWQLPQPLKNVRQSLEKYDDGDKQFIEILLQIKEFGLNKVSEACQKALSQGISQAQYIIEQLYDEDINKSGNLNTETPTLTYPPSNDCSVYNKLYLQHASLRHQEASYAA